MTIDVSVQNHGTIIMLVPETEAGETWLEENIGQDNGFQPYWPTAIVEPRYAGDIICGMANDGLALDDDVRILCPCRDGDE